MIRVKLNDQRDHSIGMVHTVYIARLSGAAGSNAVWNKRTKMRCITY